jgi:hypothetical protein
LLEPGTFSLENYGEAERVLAEWQDITISAPKIYAKLPKESRDAFYQLVLYPTKASAVVNELYIAVAKNRALRQARNDPRANDLRQARKELFATRRKTMSDLLQPHTRRWKMESHDGSDAHRLHELAAAGQERDAGSGGSGHNGRNAGLRLRLESENKPQRAGSETGAPKDWRGFIEQTVTFPSKQNISQRRPTPPPRAGKFCRIMANALRHDNFSIHRAERDATGQFARAGISDVAHQHWRSGSHSHSCRRA